MKRIRIIGIALLSVFMAVSLTTCGGGGGDGNEGNGDTAVPTGVSVLAGAGEVTVSWNSVDDSKETWSVDSYNIYLSSEKGVNKSNYRNLTDGMKFADVRSPYTITCLDSNKTYYVVVTTVTVSYLGNIPAFTSESQVSTEVSATPSLSLTPPPLVPTGFIATADVNKVTLTWDPHPPGENVSRYILYMASTPWDTWTDTLPDASRYPNITGYSHTVTGLKNGTTYWFALAAYCGQASAQTDQVSAIPLMSGSWVTKASMTTRRLAAAGGVIHGRLYVAGGCCPRMASLEVYDPLSDSWESGSPMPTERLGAAGDVIHGRLYVVGGCCPRMENLQVYDPLSDSWENRTPMPTARYRLATGVINGILYAIGGQDDSGNILSTVEAYDPVTDKWVTKSPMPTARYALAAGVIDGMLYAVGGIGSSRPRLSTVEAYEPATDTWINKTAMPTPRWDIAAGVINNELYVVGGLDHQTNEIGGLIEVGMDILEVYKPLTDEWVKQIPMLRGRYSPVAGAINGKLYVAGGGSRGSFTSTLQVYTPPH